MKQSKVLKSLAELSPELLWVEAARPEQTEPHQRELTAQEGQLAPQEVSVSTGSDTRGYQRWGINE